MATPATAALVTVPWSVPVPVWIVIVTLIVESAPLVTVLPNWSSTDTTGCVPKAERGGAPAGLRRVGELGSPAAGLTVKLFGVDADGPGDRERAGGVQGVAR